MSFKLKQFSVSVFDQALYSINNFFLNIVLARTISNALYGEFAVIFSILLFISGFQNAIITEPMSVLGPAKFGTMLKKYFRQLLVLNSIMLVGISLLILLIGTIFFSGSMKNSLLTMAIISPIFLNFWFCRRYCYVIQKPLFALFGTLVYSFFFLLLLFTLSYTKYLTGINALWLLGVASVMGSLFSTFFILRTTQDEDSTKKINSIEILHDHWQYGKWVTGSAVINWFNSLVIVPASAVLIGYTEAGIFRGLQNFILPVQQIFTSMTNYLLPSFALQRKNEGDQAVIKRTTPLVLLFFSITVVYSILLFILKDKLLSIVFPSNGFGKYSWLLGYLGIALVFDSITQTLSTVLRSFNRPDAIFWSQLGGVFGFCCLGLFLIQQNKVHGTGQSQVVISLVNMVIILTYFIKLIRKRGVIQN